MRTVTRSIVSGAEGCGESDLEDGNTIMRASLLLHGRQNCNYNKFTRYQVGITALLFLQHAAAAVIPTSIPANPNLGGIIKIPADVGSPPRERFQAARNNTDGTKPIKSGHNLEFDKHIGTVLKRSEKTMVDYKGFIDKNCLDIDSSRTFFSWEHDQFALHLKKKFISKGSYRDRTGMESMKLRALLAPDWDVAPDLSSMCKPSFTPFDELELQMKSANDHLENEIVNSVFANMYKKSLAPVRPIVLARKKKLELHDEYDEALSKEINKVLKR